MNEIVKEPCLDGRTAHGTFAPGNSHGTGANGYTAMGQRVKSALAKATTVERMTAVLDKLFAAAERGEPWAIREVLDRAIGRPNQTIEASVTGSVTMSDMNEDELRRMASALVGIAVAQIVEPSKD